MTELHQPVLLFMTEAMFSHSVIVLVLASDPQSACLACMLQL